MWESKRALSGIRAQHQQVKLDQWLENHQRWKRGLGIQESQPVDAVLVEIDGVRVFAWVEGEVTEIEFPSVLDQGFHDWLRALVARV
jgi:hypothetical protein